MLTIDQINLAFVNYPFYISIVTIINGFGILYFLLQRRHSR